MRRIRQFQGRRRKKARRDKNPFWVGGAASGLAAGEGARAAVKRPFFSAWAEIGGGGGRQKEAFTASHGEEGHITP